MSETGPAASCVSVDHRFSGGYCVHCGVSELTTLRTQVESLSRERDQAMAACAAYRNRLEELLEVHEFIDNEDCHQTKATRAVLRDSNPGQPLLDQLHAYQSGVVEAVDLLNDSPVHRYYVASEMWCERRDELLKKLRQLVEPTNLKSNEQTQENHKTNTK